MSIVFQICDSVNASSQYLFPLLYLTLKRHLEVFHYACRHIVDSEEFPNMSTSLRSILDLVEERVQTLKGMDTRLILSSIAYDYSVQRSPNKHMLIFTYTWKRFP